MESPITQIVYHTLQIIFLRRAIRTYEDLERDSYIGRIIAELTHSVAKVHVVFFEDIPVDLERGKG